MESLKTIWKTRGDPGESTGRGCNERGERSDARVQLQSGVVKDTAKQKSKRVLNYLESVFSRISINAASIQIINHQMLQEMDENQE